MTTIKKRISACELQRQIDHKRTMTIWSVMQRLRAVMRERFAISSACWNTYPEKIEGISIVPLLNNPKQAFRNEIFAEHH